MLVIAPHPDDETLAAGGLIARQTSRDIPIHVVAVTDGENAYNDGIDITFRRSAEQTSALKRLGVVSSSITRLKLTDSGISDQEELLVKQLMPFVFQETNVLAYGRETFISITRPVTGQRVKSQDVQELR